MSAKTFDADGAADDALIAGGKAREISWVVESWTFTIIHQQRDVIEVVQGAYIPLFVVVHID